MASSAAREGPDSGRPLPPLLSDPNQYGYYDVTITATTNDGFTQRYAGRIG